MYIRKLNKIIKSDLVINLSFQCSRLIFLKMKENIKIAFLNNKL